VVPASVADVAEAVRFARFGDLPVAVQATGHGVARPADGAVLIVTATLDGVTVDPAARTAYVGAGALWNAVLEPAQEHGLAPLLGSTPFVGAVGYTLGGGMGWLARRHGLASDSVRAFDVVTPDGIEVRASAQEQPELFWALRGGGGGSLGVVVGMEIELFPVTTVYAGNLLYPAEAAAEVLRRWRDWVAGVGEELTSAVTLMNFPPLPEVPEPLRGGSFVLVRGAWCGDLDEGKALIDQWRSWRTPVADMFGPLPFAQIAAVSQDPVDPMPSKVTSEWFDTLPDEAIDVLVRSVVPAPGKAPALVFGEVRHAGGAIRAGAAAAANDRGRSGEFLLELVGVPAGPEAARALDAHLRGTREALAPHVTGAAYLNFLEGAEKQERTPAAFSPRNLARLRAVKAALDPADRFRHGFGVLPG
jgi:FAD/FMN-containing dehydrogenase